MKRRYLYALMYSVPAFIFSVVFMVVVTAAIGGVLWIFIYGDNPWPSFIDRYSPIFMIAVLATAWLILLWAAFAWGKRQEALPSLNMKHLYLAAGSTAALVLAVLIHQLSVGNIGPKADVLACADFCAARKLSATFPQDGTCHCYGSDGIESTIGVVEQVDSPQARTVIVTDCGLGGAVIVRDSESNPIAGASVELHVAYRRPGADEYTRVMESTTDSDGISHVGGLGSCNGSIFSALSVSTDGFIPQEISVGRSWGVPKVVVLQGIESHNNPLNTDAGSG